MKGDPQGRSHRIRVLHVIWRLSNGGGIQTVVRRLLEDIDVNRVALEVFTIRPHFAEDRTGAASHATVHEGRLRGRSRLLRIAAMARLIRTVWRTRPDVLHLHGGTAWHAIPASIFVPRVGRLIELHDAPTSGRDSRLNISVERWMHRALGFRLIVNSAEVQRAVANSYRVSEGSIDLVTLGVDVDKFDAARSRREAVRARLGIGPTEVVVLYVCRLVTEKRPGLFLDVAREVVEQHPHARFVLAGDGTLASSLARRVREDELEDRVLLTGFVDDLEGLYGAADVFVSTSGYEGFGLAVAEAMAAGLPVVVVDVGGVGDVVGEAGVLVRDHSLSSLVEAVRSVLADPQVADQLAALSRDRARSVLGSDGAARRYEAIYLNSRKG